MAKPLKRDMINVTTQMVEALPAENKAEVMRVSKVHENTALMNRCLRAINNWSRAQENPMEINIDTLIQQAMQDPNEEQKNEYNPLRCWNDDYSKADVQRVIHALAMINKDFLNHDIVL